MSRSRWYGSCSSSHVWSSTSSRIASSDAPTAPWCTRSYCYRSVASPSSNIFPTRRVTSSRWPSPVLPPAWDSPSSPEQAALLVDDALLPVELFGGSFLVDLFWFNLIIAAFNLLPAFPLDGGRVFRALLERRYDLERATHVGGEVGRAVAVVLVVSGVVFDCGSLHRRVRLLRCSRPRRLRRSCTCGFGGRRVEDAMLLESGHRRPDDRRRRASSAATSERATRVPDRRRRSATRGWSRPGPSSTARRSSERSISPSVSHRGSPPPTSLEDTVPLVASTSARALSVFEHGRIVGAAATRRRAAPRSSRTRSASATARSQGGA